MSEVVKLQTANTTRVPEHVEAAEGETLQPYAPLVDMLERLTALAKRGELRGAGVVVIEPNDVVADLYAVAPDASAHLLVAGVTYLQQRLAAEANR